MPSVAQSYEVLLDFINDIPDSATVQLLKDYRDGCRSGSVVLLRPGESVSLVLDAGDSYSYTVKTKQNVVNLTFVVYHNLDMFSILTLFSVHELGETSSADYRNSSLPPRS